MSNHAVEIDVYSHGFSVKYRGMSATDAVRELVLTMAQYEWVKRPPNWRSQRVVTRTYTGATNDGRRWFSIFQLEDFMRLLSRQGLTMEDVKIVDHALPESFDVDFPRNDEKPPREYQVPIIDFFKNSVPIKHANIVGGKLGITNLQTGKGKTLVTLQTMTELGKRTLIQMKGGYIHRWIDDLEALFKFKKKDILVIRGASSLKALMYLGINDELEAKVILLSTRTYYAYLKDYEENGADSEYPIHPIDFYGQLGVGLKVIDEVHEDFHLQLRSNIYSNVERIVCLSATLETDDDFLKKLYKYSLPQDRWYVGIDYDAYVNVIAAFYRSSRPGQDVTTIKGSSNYSHVAYEQYIMEDAGRLNRYLDFIYKMVMDYYLADDYSPGQKCLIFCSLTQMCGLVSDHLNRKLSSTVEAMTYTHEDDPKVLELADVIVSTVGSAGTAVDIYGLRTMILTRAINRREANEQIKGRGRRLVDWPDVTPTLVYFVNEDIEKHVQYHTNKVEQYEGKVSGHTRRDVAGIVI